MTFTFDFGHVWLIVLYLAAGPEILRQVERRTHALDLPIWFRYMAWWFGLLLLWWECSTKEHP